MDVFLDCQQWNYLVDPPDGPLGLNVGVIRKAISERRIRVVGSLELFEELLPTGRASPEKFNAMSALFTEFVGRRILRPLDERVTMEVIHGGLLPERKRYHSRRELAAVVGQGVEGRRLGPLFDAIHSSKSDFKGIEEGLRSKVRAEIEEAGGKITPALVKRWHQNVDTGEWLESVIQGGVARGRYPMPNLFDTTFSRFPSAWTFIEIRLARLVATIGESRKISESDDADMRHAAAGPYFDVMVTDDQELRRTLDVVRHPPFRCTSSPQLAKELDLAH